METASGHIANTPPLDKNERYATANIEAEPRKTLRRAKLLVMLARSVPLVRLFAQWSSPVVLSA